MASPLEYAKLLISKAQDDKIALDVLLVNPQVSDEIVGFHAQQVITYWHMGLQSSPLLVASTHFSGLHKEATGSQTVSQSISSQS